MVSHAKEGEWLTSSSHGCSISSKRMSSPRISKLHTYMFVCVCGIYARVHEWMCVLLCVHLHSCKNTKYLNSVRHYYNVSSHAYQICYTLVERGPERLRSGYKRHQQQRNNSTFHQEERRKSKCKHMDALSVESAGIPENNQHTEQGTEKVVKKGRRASYHLEGAHPQGLLVMGAGG